MSATALVRRHGVVLVGLLTTALTGWLFLAWAVMDMANPLARLMMPMSAAWDMPTATAVFAMWSIMMAAMMLPSAAPMVLVFAHLARRGGDWAATWVFVGAYVLMWAGFSSLAAVMHWALQAAGLLSPMMVSVDPLLTAVLLITAGAFQFTPIKTACLTRCRSPVSFLMTEWRKGRGGAFVMGMRHGMYCIGCCWALMALLFVIGVMNLPMVAMIAIAVALEKLAPKGVWIARVIGGVLVFGGVWMLFGGTGMISRGMASLGKVG
jgi:predicted metal-binding membrane protein